MLSDRPAGSSDIPDDRPARIAPLAVLPVFLKLHGRRAVVSGGSEGAAWKAELLAAAGASVVVFAPEPDEAMRRLAESPGGRVHLHERAVTRDDLSGAAVAIGDGEDAEAGAAFAALARAAGVPVNIIDRPEHCEFQFGSVVNRSPLVVGISTDGAAPVFGQAIRARIETLLPQGFQRWAEAAASWRPLVQARSLPFQARRRLWERFAQAALRRPETGPSEADREALASGTVEEHEGGSVVLVGAGPGDPELLTLKAVRALQSADVVLHDDLVSDAVLDFARREARRLVVGKRGGRPSCKQDDINRLMVQLARQGKRVVRLKGGDPMVFGRAGEEIAACRAAGVPVTVVPGITAALGAASDLAVSLTHRDHARRLQFITAHARNGRLPEDLDWRALADPAVTTAVYMGKAVLGELGTRLQAAGLPATTPVILVENATRESRAALPATVGTMAATLADAAPEGPCVLLIGSALSEADALSPAAVPAEPDRRSGT